MRALATTLALVASVVSAAEPAATPATEAAAAPASTSTPTATPTPTPTPAPAPAPAPAPLEVKRAPVVPSQQLVDKLGQGDRMYLAGDFRGSLFAYQEAVYLQPRYAPARVRLGRAYLALRYPAQAMTQAEAALAEDPDSADGRALLEEARAAAAKAQAQAAAFAGGAAPATQPPPARSGPRSFKLTPEPEALPARPSLGAPAAAAGDRARPPGQGGAATPAQAEAAAQHYRTALGHLQDREFAKAVTALSDAILADPRLAVAHSARGSAHFGLGKYREAAEDYRQAVALDAKLATPVYGLAECYRVLGEGKKAAEMYDRYARSDASDVRDDLRAAAAKRADELR